MRPVKVKFEYTMIHSDSCFEITFQVEATVWPGTPGFTGRDGVYDPGTEDEANITGLWLFGAGMNTKTAPLKLLTELERAAIEHAYNNQNRAAYAVAEYN